MRELSYQLPYQRLTRLSRSMNRKAFRNIWRGKWALYGTFLAIVLLLSVYGNELDFWLQDQGLAFGSGAILLVAFIVLAVGVFRLRRTQTRQLKARSNYDQLITLKKEDGGLRFATEEAEYYLKWPGITQMLVEPDGAVISHGSLFFLVPNAVFETDAERLGFIRDVYAQLKPEAKTLSKPHIEPVLAASASSSSA